MALQHTQACRVHGVTCPISVASACRQRPFAAGQGLGSLNCPPSLPRSSAAALATVRAACPAALHCSHPVSARATSHAAAGPSGRQPAGVSAHRAGGPGRHHERSSSRLAAAAGTAEAATPARVAAAPLDGGAPMVALVLSEEDREYYREVRGAEEVGGLVAAAPADFYALLGLELSAQADEVKAAYRRLARLAHPDIAGEAASDLAAMLNCAYATLSGADRAAYDAELAHFRRHIGTFDGRPMSTWAGPEHERRAVFVDESSCIGCRHCTMCAPDTFAMEEDWGRARVATQWADAEDAVREAVDMCPVDCIYFVARGQLALLEYVMKGCKREDIAMMARRRSGNLASAPAKEDPFIRAEVYMKYWQEAQTDAAASGGVRRVQDERLAAAIARAWLAAPRDVRDRGWPDWGLLARR